MKEARVKPLYKKGSQLDVGNYRPVSILTVVSKVLEKCVSCQLNKFLTDNNILYEFQSGFRGKFSTDTCLIHLLDHIRDKNSEGLFTGMVLLDLQKAFDTVDHNILCGKLTNMGIQAHWFQSYLSGRSQMVGLDGILSDSSPVTCGVPQGSILGPLLFLCYVNDMATSIDADCKLILYADDSAILFSHRDPETISMKLGTALESCSDWLVDNKLSLHLGKTECIMFGPMRKLKAVDDFFVKCHGFVIKSTDRVKYLGVTIDKFLKCDLIVENVINKVNTRLKFLYRNGSWLNTRSRLTLSSALIQCYFYYCCSSWHSSLAKSLTKKLQIMQNKVIRFILNLGPRTRITCDILESVNMLYTSDRVTQLRLNHVFNIFNGNAPNYLFEHFERNEGITRGATNLNYTVPRVGSQGTSNFYYNAILDWNSLPVPIKQISNKSGFKEAVKSHLLEVARQRENDDFINI